MGFINVNRLCNISEPIGSWLENNTGPCNEVKGNFILDKTANKFAKELFSAFSELKKIEGCIYVFGFTGAKNLSFFSKLENVTCSAGTAAASNLKDVIYVVEPSLRTMGFDSLKTVQGPGRIYLSFEANHSFWFHKILPEDRHCFSKEEMTFLAFHPQFRSRMYPPCELEDPCWRLERKFHDRSVVESFLKAMPDGGLGSYIPSTRYRIEEMPDGCTIFVGSITIVGPYTQDDPNLIKFKTMSLLIGQLYVMGTMLTSLKDVFPNLQAVYPYEMPNYNARGNDNTKTIEQDASQRVSVSLNRFLDPSLPFLQPIRPLDIALSVNVPRIITDADNLEFDTSIFLSGVSPENRCRFYPQFNASYCGCFTALCKYPEEDTIGEQVYPNETWIISMILIATGLTFSIRAVFLLEFSHTWKAVPYCRHLLVVAIVIATLTAIEGCLIDQKTLDVLGISDLYRYFFSEYYSTYLNHPLFYFLTTFLVSGKHVCLAIVIYCYLDIAIFNRTRSHKISLVIYIVMLIFTGFFWSYLNSQLFLAIRIRRPYYSERINAHMPFVMNVNYMENFNFLVPSTTYLSFKRGYLQFQSMNNFFEFDLLTIPLELFGKALPEFSSICDAIMAVTAIVFYTLKFFKFIRLRENFIILILLYVLLSANRIRDHIYHEILHFDYCARKVEVDENDPSSNPCDEPYYGYYVLEPFMDHLAWDLIEKIMEKLAYILYSITSFYCYVFARHHFWIGNVLHHKEKKKKLAAARSSDKANYDKSTTQQAASKGKQP